MHLLSLLPILSILQLPSPASAVTIQAPAASLAQTNLSATRAQAVRDAWQQSYTAYRRHAFGFDNLKPVSQTGGQSRNGWGATIIDSLDVLSPAMMNFPNWYKEAITFVGTVDFTKSVNDQAVSIFETTIRYLGGLLSTYNISTAHEPILLQKAQQLGTTLSLGWSKGTVIPYGFVNLTTKQPFIQSNNIAEAGTLLLEFNALSTYGGNATYRALAEATNAKLRANPAVFPGLLASAVNPANNAVVGDLVSWGPACDSFYEYLVKYALYTGNTDTSYLAFWQQAVSSSITKLLKTSSVGDHLYLTDYSASNGGNLYISSHLACYAGGNWVLGGKMLANQTIINYGLSLIDACHNTYNKTVTGIGPEVFGFVDKATGSNNGWTPSASDTTFYNANGFATVSGRGYHLLRPEVVESYFYAWRITGDTKYQEWAWEAFQHLLAAGLVNNAYASVSDVNATPAPHWDNTETFWYSETLKFLWLTFTPGSTISLDDYVISTEGHPFPIQKKASTFRTSSHVAVLDVAHPGTLTTFEVAPVPAPSGIPALLPVDVEVLENTVNQLLEVTSHGVLQEPGAKSHKKIHRF
ncbi:glycoside hydrolase family 47 protein [Atractiella rhizophila]|nr:glycoside hydrolase family 47 protein [Atractiella rhizophila]